MALCPGGEDRSDDGGIELRPGALAHLGQGAVENIAWR